MDINEDTIVGISTPIGKGAIGIVRISGTNSIEILKKIFKNNKNLKSHTINYGYIIKNNTVIDEVLVSIMLAPKTYTCEDLVEINCHGGTKSIQKILNLVLENGARLAQPGEFTKRAFINGRIDLSQAEAVIDIINSKTNLAHKAAVNMLEGHLSKEVKKYRNIILEMIANIEASIDYPEHDMESMNIKQIKDVTKNLIKNIDKILQTENRGKILKEGINTVILGKPNVGKSSLLNLIVNEERAIVTEIEGTTRDILQEHVEIEGIPFIINDTAGIRNTDNVIEKIGITKSKELINKSDLILILLDWSKKLIDTDIDLLKSTIDNEKIIIINKCDLEKKIDISTIEKYVNREDIIIVSIKEKIDIDKIYKKMKDKFFSEDICVNEEIILGNLRHKTSLISTKESLEIVLNTIENGFTEDFISIDLQNAYKSLGEIIGETVDEDIIDKIFSNFCLGK